MVLFLLQNFHNQVIAIDSIQDLGWNLEWI